MLRPITAIACLAALTACASDQTASNAGMAGRNAAAAAMAAPAAPDYVMMAGASDLFEIQSSQVALQKTQNAEIRAFAQMMIDHHTQTSAEVMAAAKAAGLNPAPPALPADKQQKIAMLQSTAAAGFDAAYMREQLAGHSEALALHQSYAANGDAAPLKRVASKAVPIVETHLTRARTLAGSAR